MTGKIIGIGSYIPKLTVENDEISKFVETSDEWIRERTGIERRHIISEDESTTQMAAAASEEAIKDAELMAEDIDLIIVATTSPSDVMPSTACMVQEFIGAYNATCFDLAAACSGFLYAYNVAIAQISCGMSKNALIIGSESLSNIVNWNDRGSCILFGDGAGAAVVSASDEKYYASVTHSDGRTGGALTLESRFIGNGITKDKVTNFESDDYRMYMDGREVFKFAVSKVPEAINEVLSKNNVSKDEIKYYVLHQANGRIIDSVAKRLKESMDKFPRNVNDYGNTSSASIPILLDEMKRKKMLEKSDKIVIAGFGGGLTWGATILEW
ncbi:MAG: beta-ketoacyl-ACP synthase III [Suipraeoptans sp.]